MNMKTMTLSGLMILGLCSTAAFARKPAILGTKPAVLSKYNTRDQNIIAFQKQMTALKNKAEKSKLPTGKTTALNSRLIAEGYREFDGSVFSLNDTMRASYTGARGGDLKSDYLKYDLLTGYDVSTGTPTVYYVENQLFDVQDNIIYNKTADWDNSVMMMVDYSRDYFSYNTDNKRIQDSAQQWDGSAWENYNRTTFTYSASKMVASETAEQWNGTAWEYTNRTIYTYTAADKVATTQVEFWTGSGWLPFAKLSNTYDAITGTLTTELIEIDMTGSGTMEPYSLTKYVYDAAKNAIIEDQQGWNSSSSAWENNFTRLNTFDASGNKTITIESYRDDVSGMITDTFTRNLYTYNSYKQMTRDESQQFDPATHAFVTTPGDYRDTYYYEEFSPAGIKENPEAKATVNLYPVPARDVLNITANMETAQAITISVSDIQGRVMQTVSLPSASSVNTSISVENIPSGNYFIQLIGNKGAQVARQIIVAH
ncbi:MAG: T9SS type A sorting domain-containing protein [Chitinophagaceae bacterium]|jgi:hypothetical protein